MLPSMPILFNRDSQDAFGNNIEPSTSFFHQVSTEKFSNNTTIRPAPLSSAQEPLKKVDVVDKTIDASSKGQDGENKAKAEGSALEIALITSYYRKVQTKFSSHTTVPTNKFVQFQSILKSFDPSKETPVDLYRKIESLFGEEHKDLVEEFLLFLKPGQAAEIGRFMDHFVMTQMTNFIAQLQNAFVRKPTVLRKILRAITTGINSGSSEEMKTRVLPHLRSNARLTQMFKSLFPEERPQDSVYELNTDTINESFLTGDKGYDVWEFEEEGDNKRNIESKERLDTMYLHGRVFLQHGRMLRSARVTYPYSKEPYRVHSRRLAPNHSHLSPPESDEERASPKRQNKNPPKVPPKKPKRQLKSPTKSAKDFNDNTNKECVSICPKVIKNNHAKRKTSKDKKDDTKTEIQKTKKDKTDSKNSVMAKKNDAKAKQAKSDPHKVEMKEETFKIVKKFVPAAVEVKPVEVKASWTRDEDKTMLQVLKGEAGSEEVFGRISELLPHRSVTEIKERFCHVMNLLQQMAVGKVTL